MRYTKRLLAGLALLAAALLAAPGCSSSGTGTGKPKDKDGAHEAHPEHGPHEGALAEWGEEEYHAEFTVDHKAKKATVYILDGSAKKVAPVGAESIALTLTNMTPPLELTLKADPQEGDPEGKASRFSATHEKLGEEMDFKGTISGKVGDTPYSGTFEEKEHD